MAETISEGLRETIPDPMTTTQQAVVVEADVDQTFSAIRSTDVSGSRTVSALSALRALPPQIKNRMQGRPQEPILTNATISDLIGSRYWIVLSDHPPHELVLGLVMWNEGIRREGLTHASFERPGPGSVRVGWSFTVQPLQDHRSLLVTETRTSATDDAAARRFGIYWKLISPFAGLTRRLVLEMIAREAGLSRAEGPSPIRLAS